jgi:signal peptidase II
MCIGQSFEIFGPWSQIHFIENNGMAFGMEFAGRFGKIFLTVFRAIAIGAIGWYLYTLIKKGANKWLVVVMSLILAGAVGNLIDSAFYGLIFSESTPFDVAQLFPPGGGYGTFLHGKVVDMLYFPMMHGTFPTWLPFWGGEEFEFFSPVFNIADSSITVGVLSLLVFQKKLFAKPEGIEK